MKKLISVLFIVFFLCGILLTSCNIANPLCPAYPYSPLNSELEKQQINPNINCEYLDIEVDNEL